MGGFSSFFESLFGGQGGGWHTVDADGTEFGASRSRARAGRSVEAEITLSLEDAYRGATLSFSIDAGNGAGPKSYDVRIPAGTTEGRTIRLKGQGGPGRAGAPDGDLLLRVRLAPHPRFTVNEFDLSTTLPIAPWEAALGAKVSLTTLDGSEAIVQVPAGSSSGKKLRLRGLGFPRQQDARGDLLVELRIVVPDSLTDAERKLYEELAQKSPFRPR